MNVAIVYSGSIRDNGTPYYFRRAFAEVLGEQPAWYTEEGKIPEGHDFYFHLDDGRDDLEVSIPGRWGYYATDTHLGPGPRLEKAKAAERVWCAQKPAAEEYQRLGLQAEWLPLACDPFHHPAKWELWDEDAPTFDLAFVGYLGDPGRVEFLDAVFKAVPDFWFQHGVFHEDMARVYHRARLGLNHAVRDDLNMRFFELASVGVPQVCDARMVGLADLGFRPFEHYIPYASRDEAVLRIGEALSGVYGSLEEMARRAHERVRAGHTYADRVREMLRAV